MLAGTRQSVQGLRTSRACIKSNSKAASQIRSCRGVQTPRLARTLSISPALKSVDAADLSREGSQYENYNDTSKTYDNWRKPISIEDYLFSLGKAAQRLGKNVDEILLLEAGCGTGNYMEALAPHVGECVGVEFSEGMLKQAQEKFQDTGNVTVKQGNICNMTGIESESVDAVMVNQVIHHLYNQQKGFDDTKAALREICRAVKPGGTVILQTQTPTQHRQGFWWADLVPNAAEELAGRFPTTEFLQSYLCGQLGMVTFRTAVPDEPLVRYDLYANIKGPFDEGFRKADSTWALVTDAELEAGLKKLEAIISSGSAESYMAEREQLRAAIGQTTTVSVVKPS